MSPLAAAAGNGQDDEQSDDAGRRHELLLNVNFQSGSRMSAIGLRRIKAAFNDLTFSMNYRAENEDVRKQGSKSATKTMLQPLRSSSVLSISRVLVALLGFFG